MSKFYLIKSENVGPNQKDSHGHYYNSDGNMLITTKCGETNMSHEERTSGWLGTCNDWSSTAYGEFDSLGDARRAADELGYTQLVEDYDYEEGEIEMRQTDSDSMEQWEASEYFDGLGRKGTCNEYGINAETTNAELKLIVERAESEADNENVNLHGTDKLFTELRDDLLSES